MKDENVARIFLGIGISLGFAFLAMATVQCSDYTKWHSEKTVTEERLKFCLRSDQSFEYCDKWSKER